MKRPQTAALCHVLRFRFSKTENRQKPVSLFQTQSTPLLTSFFLFSYGCTLCGQHFSAFSSSGCQNFSAVGSCHSFTKAVYFRSLSFFRLECHFHRSSTSFSSVWHTFFANKRFFYYMQETPFRQGISQIFSPSLPIHKKISVIQFSLFFHKNRRFFHKAPSLPVKERCITFLFSLLLG